ncbi:MAG: hypothetical protein KDD33_06350 [Bdellovibrionales bacterium]|nr:hypothetical protein [Bdellovibrionales bacterium]
MKAFLITLALILAIPSATFARDIFKIQVGRDYDRYSNKELRRRVWELERAVAQLQDQVFQLAMDKGHSSTADWTCHIQSFSKTHVASGRTKASAIAQVLKKCSDATSSVHCAERDVVCSNE